MDETQETEAPMGELFRMPPPAAQFVREILGFAPPLPNLDLGMLAALALWRPDSDWRN